MACVLVPAVEAIVTTVLQKTIERKEKANGVNHSAVDGGVKISLSHKLKWLNNMLWGGSALLAFEHIWHGEIIPYFPFLTAAANPADTAKMLHEMATSGVAMAVLVTAVWAVIAVTSDVILKKSENQAETVQE